MQQSGIQSAEAMRAVFEDVLAAPDFRRIGTSPLIGWVASLANALERLIVRLLPVLGETEARIVSWVLLLAMVATISALLLRSFQERPPTRRPEPMSLPQEARPRTAAEWMSWAREAAHAGRLREAATGVYQAKVLQLDAGGVLRYREWKTPGDYAMEMAAGEPTRAAFLDFLGRFLELAFGPAEPTEERFEAFSAAASRIGGRA